MFLPFRCQQFHFLLLNVRVDAHSSPLALYRRLGGPPRVIPLAAAADCAGFLAPVPVVPVLGGGLLLPGRGNLVPNARSNLLIICGLGMALPDSYSATTCGFSLMAVPSWKMKCMSKLMVWHTIMVILPDPTTYILLSHLFGRSCLHDGFAE
jgi:hypothetical protein